MKDHFGCPVQATINVVSGKWKVVTIWHLGFSARRFAALRDLLPGISEKVLAAAVAPDGSRRNREARSHPCLAAASHLFADGAGEQLIEPLGGLCSWGTRAPWACHQTYSVTRRGRRNESVERRDHGDCSSDRMNRAQKSLPLKFKLLFKRRSCTGHSRVTRIFLRVVYYFPMGVLHIQL